MNRRDQQTLLGGAILLVLILGYFWAWAPFWEAHQQRNRQVQALRQDLAWMSQAAQEINRLRATQASDAPQTPLLGLINQSLSTSPLNQAQKRIEPKGEDNVSIVFNQVAFDDLVHWLGTVGLHTTTLLVEKRPEPGMVQAKITLTR